MRIKLDEKHWLNSDSQCYWITTEVKITKGSGAGNVVERRTSGYTRTFSEAVNSFVEAHIRQAEIDDFAKLANVMEELKKTVEGWVVNLAEIQVAND